MSEYHYYLLSQPPMSPSNSSAKAKAPFIVSTLPTSIIYEIVLQYDKPRVHRTRGKTIGEKCISPEQKGKVKSTWKVLHKNLTPIGKTLIENGTKLKNISHINDI